MSCAARVSTCGDEEQAQHNPRFHWYARSRLARLLAEGGCLGKKLSDVLAVHGKGLFSLG